jgi:DNA-binding response OmpR family regulator
VAVAGIAEPPSTSPPAPAVLVIDDDADARVLVARAVDGEGFSVLEADSGGAALALLRARRVDVVVLDLGLPDRDGFALLRDITRASRASTIVVSGDARLESRVAGLRLGADDYLVKPVTVVEIGARVAAAARRSRRVARVDSQVSFGPFVLDLAAHELRNASAVVELTPRELSLLCYLASRPRQVFTRPQLLDAVWRDESLDVATVTEHVRTLRTKIGDAPTSPRWIVTVRGVGYRFDL